MTAAGTLESASILKQQLPRSLSFGVNPDGVPEPEPLEMVEAVKAAEQLEMFTAEDKLPKISMDPAHGVYHLPPLKLLAKVPKHQDPQSRKNLLERAKILENTLESFGVKARITDAQCGPTVTRFELQPEVGVKVSKIVSLADDIALNLAAADVRIEAPIPESGHGRKYPIK